MSSETALPAVIWAPVMIAGCPWFADTVPTDPRSGAAEGAVGLPESSEHPPTVIVTPLNTASADATVNSRRLTVVLDFSSSLLRFGT